MKTSLAILALAATLTPFAAAQRGGAGSFHFSPPAGVRAPGRNLYSSAFASLGRYHPGLPYGNYPYGLGLLSDLGVLSDFYSGDSSGYPPYPALPANFLLNPSALGGGAVAGYAPQSSPQPLMIELRGDRYVRVSSGGESTADNTTGDLRHADVDQQPSSTIASVSEPASAKRASVAGRRGEASAARIETISAAANAKPAASAELPPTTLVYRDGHSESVRDYTIADGIIYARGNYYTDGYWNKKIEVSALNLSQTVRSNQDHGVLFQLPGAPNEVITRP